MNVVYVAPPRTLQDRLQEAWVRIIYLTAIVAAYTFGAALMTALAFFVLMPLWAPIHSPTQQIAVMFLALVGWYLVLRLAIQLALWIELGPPQFGIHHHHYRHRNDYDAA
jgi:hypothetical protein